MKNTTLIITTLLLLLSCKTKQFTQEKSFVKKEQNQSDSLTLKIKEYKSLAEKLKDSISVINKSVENTTKTIVKATTFKADLGNPCDSIGNLKPIYQEQKSDNHDLIIQNIKGKLYVTSKQNKDLISTNKTLKIENETLKSHSKEVEEKSSIKISELEKTVKQKSLEIASLKNKKTTHYRMTKWGWYSIGLNIILLLVIVMIIRGKLLFWK